MAKRIKRLPLSFRRDVELQIREIRTLIQGRRIELGLTQEQLAEELDVSVETMKAIESGRRLPSLPRLLHVLSCLRIGLSLKAMK